MHFSMPVKGIFWIFWKFVLVHFRSTRFCPWNAYYMQTVPDVKGYDQDFRAIYDSFQHPMYIAKLEASSSLASSFA